MIAQIASNSEVIAIDANWFFGVIITGLLMIIGYFLKRNLDKMDDMLSSHENRINSHETRITVLEK